MSRRLACVSLLQEPSAPWTSISVLQSSHGRFRVSLCWGGDVQLLNSLFWGGAPKSDPMGTKVCYLLQSLYGRLSLFLQVFTQSLPSMFNVHCSSFIGPTLGAKVCHQLYLTQQPVTNWAIYTGLALGWARDLHYLRGRQRCSWVFIRALDLRRREELQAISLSGVVRCWGGEFTRTPIPSQFWRIQTLNLAIAFIVTPRTGLMVQLLGRWCECSYRLQ